MQPTNVSDPNYFHKVVDCQWACPAHTPVPEYIRLIVLMTTSIIVPSVQAKEKQESQPVPLIIYIKPK